MPDKATANSSVDDENDNTGVNSMKNWPLKKFFRQIEELEDEKTDEVKMKCQGGVLYLYEAKSEGKKNGTLLFLSC